MGYKVRVDFSYRTKYYGTGEFGRGKAYKARKGAEKRAAKLIKLQPGGQSQITSNEEHQLIRERTMEIIETDRGICYA